MEKTVKNFIIHIALILLGFILVYPILWMFLGSFKTNEELLGSIALLPQQFSFDAFVYGWQGVGRQTFTTFFLNSLRLTLPTVAFTVISSLVVAYGFARFDFIFKKPLFAIMLSTLMLPNAVIIIPRYMLYAQLGWIDTYFPFIIPALFATNPFFIFMMVQFFRGLPRTLDESARIDGCSAIGILFRILIPLSKPAVISIALFQLIWTWNDFFNSLIFIHSVRNFTLPLALRMVFDNEAAVNWNQVMAMSFVTILPLIVIFFLAQKYFVEGIATVGLKG